MPNLNERDWGLIAVGAIMAGLVLYSATKNSGGNPVPTVETEAQFGAINADVGLRFNAGTPLDMNPNLHFYAPGYDPEPNGQPMRTLPHRYPRVTGANVSAVIHRGFDALKYGAPEDNEWMQNPPSEANL